MENEKIPQIARPPGSAYPGVMQTISERHSVRAYKPDPVARKTIVELLRAAVKAPTAMHEEPWAFVVIQDRQVLNQLSARARASIDYAKRGHLNEFFREESDIFYEAGTLILICAKPSNPFVGADCWLAAENLMLAACAMGLGTCVIGLAVQTLNEQEWKEKLGVAAEFDIYAPIILGFPSAAPTTAGRREPQIIAWHAGGESTSAPTK